MSFIRGPPARPAESRVAFAGAQPQLRFDDSQSGEPKAPANIEDLAFATVLELASLLYHRKITSLALTQMYLARLKRYDPKLHFVITLTEERALAQAKAADERSPPATIAARSTAFPGAQRICSP